MYGYKCNGLKRIKVGEQSDSLYLLAVSKNAYSFDRKNLSCEKTTTNGVTALFKNREIVVQGKNPFNIQFGDTGGFLQRNNYDAFDSLSIYRAEYQQQLIKMKEIFRSDETTPAVDYMKRLASTTPGKRHSGYPQNCICK